MQQEVIVVVAQVQVLNHHIRMIQINLFLLQHHQIRQIQIIHQVLPHPILITLLLAQTQVQGQVLLEKMIYMLPFMMEW